MQAQRETRVTTPHLRSCLCQNKCLVRAAPFFSIHPRYGMVVWFCAPSSSVSKGSFAYFFGGFPFCLFDCLFLCISVFEPTVLAGRQLELDTFFLRLFRVVFLLFFIVFTVLRTAVNSDFVYSIDGMLCNLFGRARDRIFPLSIGLSLSVVLVDTWIVERMTKVFTASAPSTMKIMVVAPPEENIFTVRCKCFRCAEVLLQPKTYEHPDGNTFSQTSL